MCQEATDSCFDPAGTVCTADANICTDDQCDGAGVCGHPNNTDPCDDGLFCTANDTCTGGTCTGSATDCSGAGDQCNDGVCNETGDICEPQPKADGTVCDDGLYCTQTDECDTGQCFGSNDPCLDNA